MQFHFDPWKFKIGDIVAFKTHAKEVETINKNITDYEKRQVPPAFSIIQQYVTSAKKICYSLVDNAGGTVPIVDEREILLYDQIV